MATSTFTDRVAENVETALCQHVHDEGKYNCKFFRPSDDDVINDDVTTDDDVTSVRMENVQYTDSKSQGPIGTQNYYSFEDDAVCKLDEKPTGRVQLHCE